MCSIYHFIWFQRPSNFMRSLWSEYTHVRVIAFPWTWTAQTTSGKTEQSIKNWQKVAEFSEQCRVTIFLTVPVTCLFMQYFWVNMCNLILVSCKVTQLARMYGIYHLSIYADTDSNRFWGLLTLSIQIFNYEYYTDTIFWKIPIYRLSV